MSTASDVREMRSEVRKFNAEINTMTRLLYDGNLSLRDFLVLSRALFGGNKDMARILADIQLFIALMGTARAVTKAFHIEIGPAGWFILGATTIVGVASTHFMMSVGE